MPAYRKHIATGKALVPDKAISATPPSSTKRRGSASTTFDERSQELISRVQHALATNSTDMTIRQTVVVLPAYRFTPKMVEAVLNHFQTHSGTHVKAFKSKQEVLFLFDHNPKTE